MLAKVKPQPPVFESRKWATVIGNYKTDALLIDTDNITATLRKADDTVVTIPIEKLDAEGRVYSQKAFSKLSDYEKKSAQWMERDAELRLKREAEERKLAATVKPEPQPPSREAIAAEVASMHAKRQEEQLADDVIYTIIDTNIIPGIKRSIDVRLNRKVSEKGLRAIALKLKRSDPKPYDRTYIGYYLPDMQVNAGYWATTYFTPDLEVRILGITATQEQALKQQPVDPSREIVGSWLDERPFGNGRIIIFEKDGRLLMENTYKDGSAGITEIMETRSPNGRRFDYKPDRGNGEYFLINSNGELQQLAEDGPFMTAKKFN